MLPEIIKKALFTIINILTQSKIDYVLIGGIAVNIWAEPRATNDIDITIMLSKLKKKDFIDTLQKSGCKIADKKTVIITKIDNVIVDFIPANTEFQKNMINNCKILALEYKNKKINLKLVNVCDLIILKLIAGRRMDIEDIKKIIRINKNKINYDKLKLTAEYWDVKNLLIKILNKGI